MENKLEFDNKKRYHYVLLGFAKFEDILKIMTENLKFYRIANMGPLHEKEIFYDVPGNMLSDSGIVISKQYENGKIRLKVRKISRLQGELKKPSKKFELGVLGKNEEPKDFSLQISSAIESAFNTKFTVDIDAFVRMTEPKIEVLVDANQYQIICGTGYRATMIFENATYRDIATNKKVSRLGVTLQLPSAEYEESRELLDLIDKQISSLARINLSRFEIAEQLLYSEPLDIEELEEQMNEDGEQEQ